MSGAGPQAAVWTPDPLGLSDPFDLIWIGLLNSEGYDILTMPLAGVSPVPITGWVQAVSLDHILLPRTATGGNESTGSVRVTVN